MLEDLDPTPSPAPERTPAPASGTASAPAAANADPAPLLGGGDPATDAPEEAAEPTWRDDWRERLAGKDDKMLSRLKRFASPENVFKSYLDLERKVSSGQLKAALPEGASEDEIAAYRKANGVPEAPDGYGLAFPENVPAGDEQKAQLSAWQEAMHKAHAPPQFVKAAFDQYLALQEQAAQQQYDAAREAAIQNVAELRSEYGREYVRNFAVANQFLAAHAGEHATTLTQTRLADGTRLGDNPAFIRAMVNAGLATMGDDNSTQSESGGGGPTINERYKAALELMHTDPKAYYSEEHQEKLLKLKTAQMAQEERRQR